MPPHYSAELERCTYRIRVIAPCALCGRPVERKPSHLERTKTGRVFCTRACRYAWMVGDANWNHGRRWRPEQRAAMAAKKRGTPTWNRGLTAATSDIVKRLAAAQMGNTRGPGNKGRYGAKSSGWRGGKSRYRGFTWTLARWLAGRRDGWQCRACDLRTTRLNVHHVIAYALNPDNSLQNLVTLCVSCHTRVEAAKLPCPTNRQLPARIEAHAPLLRP